MKLGISCITEIAARQKWLDRMAGPIQRSITGAFRLGGTPGIAGKNFLNGTWLGHPLHPVATDLTLGAWTTAFTLDAIEEFAGARPLGPGADAAVALGLASAIGTAATGLADWQYASGRARRIGLAHAALNTTATILYSISQGLRWTGNRTAGRRFSYAGLGLVTVAAYLGGDLVYGEQMGVDRSADERLPKEFATVMSEADLQENEPAQAEVEGTQIMVVRHDGRIYALGDTCPHMACSLSNGKMEGGAIICPCHRSKFSLEDGHVIDGPATFPAKSLEVRVEDDQVKVRARQR